jgi:septal ring factor EnvC (AmiA/AmiB activator)
MLNITDFQRLSQSPTVAKRKDFAVVSQIVAAMPWFADAQILLLKIMKHQNHSAYDEQFTRLSLYATYRETLLAELKSIEPAVKKTTARIDNTAIAQDESIDLSELNNS